jgi:hypothetical protein
VKRTDRMTLLLKAAIADPGVIFQSVGSGHGS